MQCKEYRKRDKKMPSTKAWDANRNENKSCIQYVRVIFVWCLAGLHAVIPYHPQLVWKHCFVQSRICVLCQMWADDDWEVPCKSVTLNSCSTLPAVHNLAEVKMCSCNHWAQGGQVTPPYAFIDWSFATADRKRFGPSLSSLWKLVVNLLTWDFKRFLSIEFGVNKKDMVLMNLAATWKAQEQEDPGGRRCYQNCR